MSITNVTTEKNLDEVLSKTHVGLDLDQFEHLRDLTLEINPNLRSETGLKPGTLIILPNLEQLHSGHLLAGNDTKVWFILQPLIAGIQAYLPQLESKLQSNIKELNGMNRKLNSKELLHAVESTKSAEAGAVIKQLKDDVQAEHKAAKVMLNNLHKQADLIPKDLSELFKALT